ncbi:acetylornithine deacetylase/succinyl-diaminopimelate desuccinylase [Cenarchaeum symbiosum A]|uniref:Acetylornithine deacetylase/succinyl-diaminopimelate desuccinylase n=1 Tax=Cenarchaeum symbiosum (strain A) TaxID=414004 RepID=A0RU83_CENSY|nr:acetylornithine deacetylase/succinyl-diaminopimelate desuccinylase [Cenarchaeum symbiosum A]
MKALREVDRGFPGTIDTLQELIRQPSVSAKNEGIEECALLVHRILKRSGITPEILRIKGAAPLVYGEVRSRANPGRTLLFYNHYDVQPAEPLDPWDHPPFGGTVRGNKIFGRGATDDKGELVTRIKAVEACLRAEGDVPCNVKFVIEGEEETGSEHIGAYLKKYRKKFACDGVIWEFGYVDSSDRPVISLGMKGLLYVELSVTGANQDAHSSLAVLIENPAWRLVCALNTMRGPAGTVLIKDWYREVKPLGKRDVRLVSKEPFDEAAFRREFGIDRFVGGIRGTAAKKALVSGATCNIAGFHSGYGGEGAKTVLPAKAVAKVDFRLVPGMDPKKQEARLRRHLLSHGFGDISVKVFHGEAAARTDLGTS